MLKIASWILRLRCWLAMIFLVLHFKKVRKEAADGYENRGAKIARKGCHMDPDRQNLKDRIRDEIDNQAKPCDLKKAELIANLQKRIDQ